MPSLRLLDSCALLAVLVAGVSGCGTGWSGDCRSGAECSGSEQCAPPEQDEPVCGMGCQVEDACRADGCPDGQVCVDYLGTCCAHGEPSSSRCVPTCPGAPCAEGETCDADGRCVPDSCAAGFSCRAHFVCDDGNPYADFHGCIRGTCTGDTECDGGACVNGRCYDSSGTCAEPELVP